MSPRDVDDLTLSEFEQLTAELDQYLREMKRGAES
jgi:hypothetical protein